MRFAGLCHRTAALALRRELAFQRLADQFARLCDAVECCERAEARAALLADQHLVDHLEEGDGHAGTTFRALLRVVLVALDLAGDPIYYARTTTTPDRHEHIMAIAIRPLRAFERLITVNMSAYPFSVIELDVDASGRGTGTIALGATLTGGPEKPLQAAPDRLVERVRLTSVKRAK